MADAPFPRNRRLRPMQLLLLGGTRFLGRTLVERLLARGDRVTLLTRGRRADPFGDRVHRLVADRRDARALAFALRGAGRFDAVVDCTAYEAADLDAALPPLAPLAARYVCVSSTAVLEPEPDAYARGKQAVEARLRREQDLDWTVLRPPIVQGAFDHTLRSWRYQLQLADGVPIPLPPQSGRFTHVWSGDVANALLALAEAPIARHRVYTVAQPEVLAIDQYLAAVAAAIGVELRRRELPYAAIAADPALARWHPYLLPPGADRVHDASLAQQDLGWRATPMRIWLPATCAWFAGPDNPYPRPD
jgi:nucleoside-diphosphate-sugar epimerase